MKTTIRKFPDKVSRAITQDSNSSYNICGVEWIHHTPFRTRVCKEDFEPILEWCHSNTSGEWMWKVTIEYRDYVTLEFRFKEQDDLSYFLLRWK